MSFLPCSPSLSCSPLPYLPLFARLSSSQRTSCLPHREALAQQRTLTPLSAWPSPFTLPQHPDQQMRFDRGHVGKRNIFVASIVLSAMRTTRKSERAQGVFPSLMRASTFYTLAPSTLCVFSFLILIIIHAAQKTRCEHDGRCLTEPHASLALFLRWYFQYDRALPLRGST